MKGHIAFCPHFHQPHFQLYRTREEAYCNSYQPWLQLLQEAVKLDSFYINLHFSGPFLCWMQDQKPEFVSKLRELLKSGKIGLIGGLADEPFIQLSSRRDDYLYQLSRYNELLQSVTGVNSCDWQGIHLVERECGELLLQEISRAARILKAVPLYYLDQETFYPVHFAYPGSDSDYCLRHFNFVDPVSITTTSHIPSEMLYFALRDEIGGESFYSIPIHSQYRYQLLKRQSFTGDDRVRIKPGHYYFYIKDALEKAAEMARVFGREIEPILLIFEDAEKFGQWSKDPNGDREWLMEFFSLVDRDQELSFTGLKNYLLNQGVLDTYPVSSSHSYPEWENWTARRGIRGVVYGDERLRRVMCRIKDLENRQLLFEKKLLNDWREQKLLGSGSTGDLITGALLDSAARYEIIDGILNEGYGIDVADAYKLINRVRHLCYQEDPKWASRHPSYGSSPYYDAQGLAYLELALRLQNNLNQSLGLDNEEPLEVRDWDADGYPEVVLSIPAQSLVVHSEGGCISYHHVLAPDLSLSVMHEMLNDNVKRLKAYHNIHRCAMPLVFSETDSSLAAKYYEEGGRREICRNSLRCGITVGEDLTQSLGGFETSRYHIERAEYQNGVAYICLTRSELLEYKGRQMQIMIRKLLEIEKNHFIIEFQAACDDASLPLFLVPQLVCTAAPSDERYFNPQACLGIIPAADTACRFKAQYLITKQGDNYNVINDEFVYERPEVIDYIYQIRGGDDSLFSNLLSIKMESSGAMESLIVRPAVKEYYKGYVFPDQSRLGYYSSGTMLQPMVRFTDGKASLKAEISWEFDTAKNRSEYRRVIDLIR
ncbi:hypothetical protein [Syntrophomonas palmitatica]|uniref:hypothetical protein n=1 Tax=Syntrophomonas palmitatica TaxID=402877 RepID=UPI0006D0C54D|nr:hypothetical protein [Syntrophomonas palmitatica]